ncbi:MAG: acetyl-CoA C-acyltransferase [Acidobacteriota bacterium]
MSFPTQGSPRRIAIVDGMRTPFARAWTVYKQLEAVDLGAAAVNGLLRASDLDPEQVDQLIFGCVSAPVNGPHVGREVIFRTGIPASVPSVSVQLYCASAARAIVDGANEIAVGNADVVIAGGVESMSASRVLFSKRFTHTLRSLGRARTMGKRISLLRRLGLKDIKPEVPGIDEPTIGKSMGQTAEIMAKDFGLTREAQDEWALISHQRAAAAWEQGLLDGEVCPVPIPPKFGETVTRDTDVRADTSLEKMAKLRPVFDRKYGTVTAANSSPLTDGAAAVLLMSEEKAKELGYEPLAYLRSYAMAAVDIQKQHLLIGPVYSAPVALQRAGIELGDVPYIEMHEAFASQVLSTVESFESAEVGEELGRSGPLIEKVDREVLNPLGGSLAYGHPFGATGARIVSQCAHHMAREGHDKAFISICAAGGHGFSMVLERD